MSNISRSKSNQTMKFGCPTECNILEKHTKWGEKVSCRPFYKKYFFNNPFIIEHISRPIVCKIERLLFLFVQVEVYQNILNLKC